MWAILLTFAPCGGMSEDEAVAVESQLDPLDGSVGLIHEEDAMTIILHLEAPDPVTAGAKGAEEVRKLIGDRYPLAAIEVVEEWLYELRAPDWSGVPDLLSTAEVAEKLGVQRQRVHQLRSHPLFPKPAFEPASGPFWLEDAIDEFLEKWDRKPGRPRRAPQAS